MKFGSTSASLSRKSSASQFVSVKKARIIELADTCATLPRSVRTASPFRSPLSRSPVHVSTKSASTCFSRRVPKQILPHDLGSDGIVPFSFSAGRRGGGGGQPDLKGKK